MRELAGEIELETAAERCERRLQEIEDGPMGPTDPQALAARCQVARLRNQIARRTATGGTRNDG